ncbi:lytic murein transglycosylase [Rhodobacteraceae bacterium CCMM004]|nr:lytic murein transglycosylase [Rhodobacteraceae bacterium CCMM004]
MRSTRRAFTVGAAALGLTACVRGGGTAPAARAAEPEWRAAPNPAFDAWVSAFRPRAAAAGIGAPTLDRALAGAGYLPRVVERDRAQTEFTRTLEDYLAIAASDERVATGRAMLARYRPTLAAIEARYGVPAEVVTAIWGMESNYGARKGTAPVISALATLAYDGRRGAFFESQLIAALRILQSGDTTYERMTGSWAGAMGHTQFIPTTYLAYAVDFTGDGRRDIWADDPTDALASAAAYLSRSGWVRGVPWGVEVTGASGQPEGASRTVAAWRAAGVAPVSPVPAGASGTLIRPGGARGPAFLQMANFRTIRRYNNSTSYVIGVGHLSDRIAGRPAIQAAFGPDRYGLTIDDRKRLQRRLTALGYDTNGVDGVVGSGTQAAISAYQAAQGLPVTGEPSVALLRRLG